MEELPFQSKGSLLAELLLAHLLLSLDIQLTEWGPPSLWSIIALLRVYKFSVNLIQKIPTQKHPRNLWSNIWMPWLSHVTVPNQPSQLPCYLGMQQVVKICDFIFQLLQCYNYNIIKIHVQIFVCYGFIYLGLETTELNGNSNIWNFEELSKCFLSSCQFTVSPAMYVAYVAYAFWLHIR